MICENSELPIDSKMKFRSVHCIAIYICTAMMSMFNDNVAIVESYRITVL